MPAQSALHDSRTLSLTVCTVMYQCSISYIAAYDRAEGAFRSTTNRILGLEKSRFALIALVWLFESLDEVRTLNFRSLKKNIVKSPCFEQPRFNFL